MTICASVGATEGTSDGAERGATIGKRESTSDGMTAGASEGSP
jgi:hypothetical protein